MQLSVTKDTVRKDEQIIS